MRDFRPHLMSVVTACLALVAGPAFAQYGYGFPIGEGAYTTYATRDVPLWENFADFVGHPTYGPLGQAVGMLVIDGSVTDRHGTRTLRKDGWCTATLIARNRILTNAHCVLDSHLTITNAWVRMDYHARDSQVTDLAVSVRPVDANFALDYAVLEVLDEHDYRPVPLTFGAPVPGESLFMIHHSDGEIKRISRRNCSVLSRSHEGQSVVTAPDRVPRDLDPAYDRFHFCDSLGGSSGSLMFADRAGSPTIVGLHFAGAMEDARHRALPEDRRFNLFVDIQAILRHTEALQPSRPTGTLTVASTPPAAAITLNGEDTGASPRSFTNLAPGTYTVAFHLDGFEAAEYTVTVRAGDVQAVNPTLRPWRPAAAADALHPGQEAELVRRATAGGRLVLASGTFHLTEQLLLAADVEIVGAGRDLTIIRGPGAGSVVSVSGPGTVSFTGLTIEHGGEAVGDVVWVGGGTAELRGVAIQGAEVDAEGSFGRGVVVWNGAPADLRDVRVRDNQGSGLSAYGAGTRVSVRNSELSTNLHGLVAFESATLSMSGSEVLRNRDSGIWISNASQVTIENTTFTANRGIGIRLGNGGSYRVHHSTAEDNDTGIVVRDAVVELRDNTIRQNAFNGLSFYGSASGSVAINTVVGNGGNGIWVTDDASPELQGNRVVRNHNTGVSFGGRARSIVEGNRVEGNGANGIAIVENAAPTLRDNVLRENAWNGIATSDSGGGRAISNTIDRNRHHGVWCGDRATTALEGNSLLQNTWHGMAFAASADCRESGSRFERNGNGEVLRLR